MKILVIAAHPDDEVLGCGGTTAKLAKQGNDVHVLILGEGVTSRDDKRNRPARGEEIRQLKRQAEKAHKLLGIKKTFLYDFPDNRFDTVPLLDIVKAIEKVKKGTMPEIVFTHHRGDLNIDHQITFRAVMTAFRPVKGERAREIYSFEIASSTEWSVPSASDHFMPNYFSDISKTIAQKIKAINEYKSEIRAFPHPRSAESVKAYAVRRGIQAGLPAAEAFEIIRIIR
ncbi:MAG: PIG-L family deacetylase [Nitrospiraceae bacterium]|nr:MAG: PIG-L family deacetylase [Nitrospiraceae bacterium]